MLYLELPKNFDSKFEVVSCFLEHDGKILLLHRLPDKPQGNTWSVPAGKIDKDETVEKALLRELYEETGLAKLSQDPQYLRKVYVKYPDCDFIYHMYKIELPSRPEIKIKHDEHQDYRWIAPREALKLDLILDEDECIKMYY